MSSKSVVRDQGRMNVLSVGIVYFKSFLRDEVQRHRRKHPRDNDNRGPVTRGLRKKEIHERNT